MGLNDVRALAQKKARAEAEVARLTVAEREARRKALTRTKILAGGAALAAARHDPGFRAALVGVLRAAELSVGEAALLESDLGAGWYHG